MVKRVQIIKQEDKMISEAEKHNCNWVEFEKFWEAEGVGLEYVNDFMASWICWVKGYTQAVDDHDKMNTKNGGGSR